MTCHADGKGLGELLIAIIILQNIYFIFCVEVEGIFSFLLVPYYNFVYSCLVGIVDYLVGIMDWRNFVLF
jgi:hypothetical protein